MFDDPDRVRAFLAEGHPAMPILVIGDLMLDRYLKGSVERISPEAPVPVVHLGAARAVAGGAANVAMNLSQLGHRVRLLGAVGDDEAGRQLLALLDENGIDIFASIRIPTRRTTVKTRVMGNHQQMLRLDDEVTDAIPDAVLAPLMDGVRAAIRDGIRAIVLSDYDKGVVTAGLCRAVIDLARDAGLPVLADPKGHDASKYAGATALTPNSSELARLAGVPTGAALEVEATAIRLRETLGLDFLVVTRGERGMTLIDGDGAYVVPTTAREVFDVSGAGDTVMAVLAAALAFDLSRRDAVRLANLAGGIKVGKEGTQPVSDRELRQRVGGDPAMVEAAKCGDRQRVVAMVEAWRREGGNGGVISGH